MPSKTDNAPQRPEADAFDSYFLEEFDDPFGSPEPEPAKNKRKEPDSLGIDEEVSVAKKARVPRIKLDETRLTSDNGIPELRRRARNLKLKGKGHEFSDASRLLSFYQLWLDDLFPKAKFLDALAMVEKAGHKTTMHKLRMDWINEGKPRPDRETPEPVAGPTAPNEPTRIAPIFEKRATDRPKTPIRDVWDGVDIYNATPGARMPGDPPRAQPAGGVDGPPDDELDALIAEAEAAESETAPRTSIFGSGMPRAAPSMFDEDDLDALMAEAEAAQDEARRKRANANPAPTAPRAVPAAANADGDDLEALIAEAEAAETEPAPSKQKLGLGPADDLFAEEEAAMAEMEGLW